MIVAMQETTPGLTRREALLVGGASLALPRPRRTAVGIADFSYAARRRADRSKPDGGINHPLRFLEHAAEIGAGGIQCGLGGLDKAATARLRARAEELGLYVQANIGFPKKKTDVDRFETQVKQAREAGVSVIRSVHLGGRRYETFRSLERWRAFVDQSWTSTTLAEPVLARHRLKLGFENHKDWRIPEMLGIFERLSSEWVGAWVDCSNSFTLLEDNADVVAALAPHAFAVHLKDMAVGPHPEGFVAADVRFGTGFHDIGSMVSTLRKANPKIVLMMEMSTRDPLKVPVFTDPYWITMGDVPARDLARTLATVRRHGVPAEKLPRVNHLPVEERARVEEENIRASLAYCRETLGL